VTDSPEGVPRLTHPEVLDEDTYWDCQQWQSCTASLLPIRYSYQWAWPTFLLIPLSFAGVMMSIKKYLTPLPETYELLHNFYHVYNTRLDYMMGVDWSGPWKQELEQYFPSPASQQTLNVGNPGPWMPYYLYMKSKVFVLTIFNVADCVSIVGLNTKQRYCSIRCGPTSI